MVHETKINKSQEFKDLSLSIINYLTRFSGKYINDIFDYYQCILDYMPIEEHESSAALEALIKDDLKKYFDKKELTAGDFVLPTLKISVISLQKTKKILP